ncbi:BTAD domain-containing putative transcriptional regulator [Nonomuraea typhae]|uniref:BTAD domain-containing putative transcriptional regulator n=1 Tax=Nonomuraea typhae TaxID=2603600 RepID=UPI001CA58945|nr:BTAD domain-containing putative transcriptional regulator [Nonomuraea typhae]
MAWDDSGEPLHVAEPKVRALLADLLVHEGRSVSADRLIEDLWGARPSRNPVGTLQARISQLRRALGDPGAIVRGPGGYRVVARRVDASGFEELLARRTSAPRERVAELEEALALWRGPAYADVADLDFARPAITRLEELRLAAVEELSEVRLALGEPVEVGDLVAGHPLRERLRAVHMHALYRAGRQSEALATYTDLRERLAGELGLDPSPEVVDLHARILRQDPALAAAPGPAGAAAARGLPAALVALVGRDGELEEVAGLLARERLVTLTGPGGVGKTSLALEAARRDAQHPDGVHLAELAGTAHPADVLAAAIGVRDDSSTPLETRIAQALRGRRVLLVLDNCEHLVEPVAQLVAALLKAAPELRVLATSQEPLGVTGERVHVVPPLAEDDAVRLFATRAGIEPGPAVRTICRRLDGIPLALELAATRVRALGADELARRLDDRFRLLSSGMRDAPARQRTLRAMIDWSWELLSEPERLVLRRLAVHADGCTLEAAEQVCAEPGHDVLDLVARLVDRSLVTPGPRYRLLESVAAYGVERLREAGEYDLVRERHTRYYTTLAESAELRGHRQREWLDRLDQESGNLRLALEGPEPLRLANAMAWYWFLRGRLGEARRSLAYALTRGGPAGQSAMAAMWLAGFTRVIGEPAQAVPYHDLDPCGRAVHDWFLSHVSWAYGDFAVHDDQVEKALAAFTALGERWGVAAALTLRAKLAVSRGDLATMDRDGARGLAVFSELGDRWGQAEAMEVLDMVAEIRGDYAEAARLREEELRLAGELGIVSPFKVSGLGRLALLEGDYARADDYHERARALAVEQSFKSAEEHAVIGLAISARRQGRYGAAEDYLLPWFAWLRQVGGTAGIAFALAELGFAAEQRGDAETALARQQEGYANARATGDPRAIALALEGLAGALSLAGRAEEAARNLGTAAALRASVGAPLPAGERLDVERATDRIRAVLDEEEFAAAFRSGESDLEERLHASGNSAITSQ